MNTSSFIAQLTLATVISSGSDIINQNFSDSYHPYTYTKTQNSICEPIVTDTSTLYLSNFVVPKESFATRYKRIAATKQFKAAYQNKSLGDCIKVD